MDTPYNYFECLNAKCFENLDLVSTASLALIDIVAHPNNIDWLDWSNCPFTESRNQTSTFFKMGLGTGKTKVCITFALFSLIL